MECTSCSCSRSQFPTQGTHCACSVPNPMSSEGLSALGEPRVQNEILPKQFWIRTKKQCDFRAKTPTQLLELGLVYKPSHEVSTVFGMIVLTSGQPQQEKGCQEVLEQQCSPPGCWSPSIAAVMWQGLQEHCYQG